MSDPFAQLRRLTRQADTVDDAIRAEVAALRATGFSLRAIAQAANLSHDTVWRWTA